MPSPCHAVLRHPRLAFASFSFAPSSDASPMHRFTMLRLRCPRSSALCYARASLCLARAGKRYVPPSLCLAQLSVPLPCHRRLCLAEHCQSRVPSRGAFACCRSLLRRRCGMLSVPSPFSAFAPPWPIAAFFALALLCARCLCSRAIHADADHAKPTVPVLRKHCLRDLCETALRSTPLLILLVRSAS